MDSPTINTKGADKIKYVDIAISLVISMIRAEPERSEY